MAQVPDYDIENSTGAQVRTDINLVLDAVKTCNSGSADPPLPVEFMLYGDESDKILKIYSTTNSQFTEIGNINEDNLGLLPINGNTAMQGALKLSDGAVNAPSLTFNTDTDTGFFKNASNVIGVTTGGIQRFTVGSYGIELRNGAVFEFRKGNNANFTAFTASESISENRTYTLPPAVVDGGFLKTNASGVLTFETIAGVPTGSVFCRAVTTVPDGYLECNGDKKSRLEFAALYAVIGTQYNTGGETDQEFRLPDLRGEFIRGLDNGRGVDLNRGINDPQTADNNSHSHGYTNTGITVSGADHNHNIRGLSLQPSIANVGITLGSGQGYQIGYRTNDDVLTGDAIKNSNTLSMSGNVGITISPDGSEARPRNIAMMYIIKT